MNISDSDISTVVTASCGQLTRDQARDHLVAQRTAAISKRDGPPAVPEPAAAAPVAVPEPSPAPAPSPEVAPDPAPAAEAPKKGK